MITVYRLENNEGEGPYKTGMPFIPTIEDRLEKHSYCPKHKCFFDDIHLFQDLEIYHRAYNENEMFYCGFKSITDLFKWFGGLIPLFYKHTDFRIVKYKAKEEDIYHAMSDNQLIFKKPN